MFLHRSFAARSFSPTSWRFPGDVDVAPPTPEPVRSYAIGSIREREQIVRRRLPADGLNEEEDFLIAVITALYATGTFED